ncbi:MAG: NAD(P)/FAD-dependent oxidoreductase, partial [Lysobacteraceae bacterium]
PRAPVGPANREAWFGWRPLTGDDLPLLGAVPGAPGLWVAAGHGMMGVSMSAATGRILTDLLTGVAPPIDPAPYRPARFG